MIQEAFDDIDELVEQRMREANIPGWAIAFTDRESSLRVSLHGFADAGSQVPVTHDTLFEIGSIAKSFTSIAILQLYDEGKLDLRAPVTDYLPWFQVQSEYAPITVDHLMNHTAGIIRGTEMAPHGLYDAWALRESKTSTPPGERWHYSSVGYKTLGFLIERLTGQSYQDAIRSRILQPLGMANTQPAITFETRKKTATGHCCFYDDRPEHSSYPNVPANWAEFGTGDGCVASTAEDLAIYLRMLINKGRGPQSLLISEENFDLMFEPERAIRREYYSYGLAIYPVDGHVYLGHGGGTAGFMSSIAADSEDGLGVACLANKLGETDAVVAAAHEALTLLRAGYHERQLPPRRPTSDPTYVGNARDYTGIYRSGKTALILTAAHGKLLLEYKGRALVLEPRGRDRFYVGHPDFALFLLEFGRQGGWVVEAFNGPERYVNEKHQESVSFDWPEDWQAYPGHYRARNPELSNFRIVIRKGTLTLVRPSGIAEPLQPLGDGSFRIGEDKLSPETIRFHAVVDGQALRADYSGCPYYRTFTP